MACSIDGADISAKGWMLEQVIGLLNIAGAKDNRVKAEDTTSVNEIAGKRYKTATEVELSLLGSFESLPGFESSVLWVIGKMAQVGLRTIVIESETITGIMTGGATVKQYQASERNLEVGEDYGNQKIIGQIILKIQRNG